MVKTLREKRAKLIADARAIMDRADAESRSMTSDESTQFDTIMADAETLAAEFTRAERLETEERALGESRGRIVRDSRTVGPDANDALRSWLLGNSADREFALSLANRSLAVGEDVRSWQNRAQSVGVAAAGGYTVAPEFMGELERALLTFGGARQAARILRTATGAELPFPTLDDTMNEGAILAELAEAGEQDLAFGSVNIGSYKYTSNLVRVSRELLNDSAFDIASEVGGGLGERIARITNRHFTVGTGTAQPQGIVTGATLGVTAASATAVTYDELVDLEHSVNAAYRRNGKFVFADSTLRELKKLKDADGRPIWNAGMTGNAPATILGYQYVINDDMAAMGANAKSILFGDMSKFIIRDVQGVILRRLDERFATQDAVGFVAFSRHDSRMIDAGTHPVKYLRQAAA